MNTTALEQLYEQELRLLNELDDSSKARWSRLERLHIIGQQFIFKHMQIHLIMLSQAVKDKKFYEVVGQIFRVCLVIPGHVFHRLPTGNVGSSRVSAFREMDVPEDLKEYFRDNCSSDKSY